MTIIIDDPENTYPIGELWAFLCIDEKGNEGIVANPFPLVTGNPKLLPKMKEVCRLVSKHTQKKIRLVMFTNKIVLEDLQ